LALKGEKRLRIAEPDEESEYRRERTKTLKQKIALWQQTNEYKKLNPKVRQRVENSFLEQKYSRTLVFLTKMITWTDKLSELMHRVPKYEQAFLDRQEQTRMKQLNMIENGRSKQAINETMRSRQRTGKTMGHLALQRASMRGSVNRYSTLASDNKQHLKQSASSVKTTTGKVLTTFGTSKRFTLEVPLRLRKINKNLDAASKSVASGLLNTEHNSVQRQCDSPVKPFGTAKRIPNSGPTVQEGKLTDPAKNILMLRSEESMKSRITKEDDQMSLHLGQRRKSSQLRCPLIPVECDFKEDIGRNSLNENEMAVPKMTIRHLKNVELTEERKQSPQPKGTESRRGEGDNVDFRYNNALLKPVLSDRKSYNPPNTEIKRGDLQTSAKVLKKGAAPDYGFTSESKTNYN